MALARSRANRTKIAVVRRAAGRHAVTGYEVMATYPKGEAKPVASLLRLTLETAARTVRVHPAHTGHPLLGDMLRR